jgi:hypothetical protein
MRYEMLWQYPWFLLFFWLQSLNSQQDEELQTHLRIFNDHQEEDYEDFSRRYDNIRTEFEYPWILNGLWIVRVCVILRLKIEELFCFLHIYEFGHYFSKFDHKLNSHNFMSCLVLWDGIASTVNFLHC